MQKKLAELEGRSDDGVHQAARIRELEGAIAARDENVKRLEIELQKRGARITELETRLAEAKKAAPRAPDDLRKIKGIGPSFEKALQALGVSTYEQIAGWSDDDVERMAQELGTTSKRVHRDGWVKSAQTQLTLKRQGG